MKTILLSIFFLVNIQIGLAQIPSVTTFGDPSHPAVLFLHGGPGATALDFELSTAEMLAQKGIFVISFDRLGEGRAWKEDAIYSYEESTRQIRQILDSLQLKQVHLIGYSFGGVLGVHFAKDYSEMVHSLTLVSAPLSFPDSFTHALAEIETRVRSKQDSSALAQINRIKTMDSKTLEYSSSIFMMAMQHGLYHTAKPMKESVSLSQDLMTHPKLTQFYQFVAEKGYQPMMAPTMGYWKNENYTSDEIASVLPELKVKIYGIYGAEDGLISPKQHDQLREIIQNEEDLKILDQASHSVYIDRQEEFIRLVSNWVKQ